MRVIRTNASDISLNAVLYAPNGCVTINACRLNLNGRIIAKKVCINGTWININAGEHDLDMLDFLLVPQIGLTVTGTFKENRRVVLDVSEITDTKLLKKEDTVWSITKDGAETDAVCLDEEASDGFHKELLFKEAGTYQVNVTATTGSKKTTVTEELVIEKDLEPVAAFTLGQESYKRDKNGKAVLTVKDASHSPDGDDIGQRIWTVYHDRNNDGHFTEDEVFFEKDGNETELSVETERVGHYRVELAVREAFADTIEKFITEEDYQKDDTGEYPPERCVTEVTNTAPEARLSLKKAKSADIVFTLGDADQETTEVYAEKAAELEKILAAKGIDARIDAVSTSTLTAQDTFAWKEYSHDNCDDYEKHIVYEEGNIRMQGYYRAARKDFLYIANDNPGRKSFTFDLQRDKTDWHSMEGGGFLFNTRVSEEKNTIQGFCILVAQDGLRLVQIDCKNLQGFRNGSYNWVQNAGKRLGTYKIGDLYAEHHFKIVTDAGTISVWDGEKQVIDRFVLPQNDYGYGFGPIVSHISHNCKQRSYFTFQNITMETLEGSSLSDIVEGYGWRPGAGRYVVHLCDGTIPELSTDEGVADLAAALVRNGAAFIGLGNGENDAQYRALLNAAQCEGMSADLEEKDTGAVLDEMNSWLEKAILAQEDAVGEYLNTDDRISYGGCYEDQENDPVYEQRWEYEYDPSVFGEEAGEKEHIIRKAEEPVTVFTETGAYAIRLKVRDNPVSDNDALDAYRLWSGTDEYEKLVIVQNRPVAEVRVEVSENPKAPGMAAVKTVYEAKDKDHPSDPAKGIREESYAYKNVKDASWTEGRMPGSIPVGETYLVKYQVKDMEGTGSDPAVAVVKTDSLLKYQPVMDEEAPEIFLTASKNEAKAGEELKIEGYACDDCGVDTFELYVDGEKVLDAFGRVSFVPEKAGTITVRAVAVDIGGNKSEKELIIPVADERDVTAPVAEITSPKSGAQLGFAVQICGTVEDETALAGYTLSYRREKETDYTEFASGTEPVRNELLGTLDLTGFADGTYEVLLKAEDAAGNVSCEGIRLHIENGEETQDEYTLRAALTDIRYEKEKETVDIYGTVTGEGHLSSYRLTLGKKEGTGESVTVSEGTGEITEGLLGSVSANDLTDGAYRLVLTVADADGNHVDAEGAFTFRHGSPESGQSGETGEAGETGESGTEAEAGISGVELTKKPEQNPAQGEEEDRTFDISLSHRAADLGTKVQVQVSLPKNVKEESVRIFRGDILLSEGSRKASFTSLRPGKTMIRAEAAGGNGEILSACAECTFYDRTDKNPPAVEITAPQNESVLTGPTKITGSVSDAEGLDCWKLEYRMDGEKKYTLLGEGTDGIKDEKLGTLDTTLLKNGKYVIRLSAQDLGGNRVSVENACTVEGGQKAGAMHIGFTDLETKLKGTKVTVNRIYDSRNKTKKESGTGWSIGMQGMRLSESCSITEGYKLVRTGSLFSTGYEMKETKSHDVVITYGDGTSDRFELTFSPQRKALVPITEVELGYRCVTNRKRKLEILGDTSAKVNGNGLFFYEEEMYDDLNYKLTTEEGTEIYLNRKKGVYKIKDGADNVIMVDQNGYRMADGTGIVFTRDEQDRITKITDPDGKEIRYGYDENDDLVSVTDRAGRTVSYAYDSDHNLISITDPMGIAIERNEYGDDGRLTATIDAQGNRTEYSYDIEGRTEAVKDRLGNTTVYVYDEKGNVLSTTDANGNTTKNTYNDFGDILTKTDAKGNVTTYAYDENGNMTAMTDAAGNTLTSSFDSANRVVSMSAADDTEILMDYDAKGNLTQVTDADGSVTDYAYDKQGHVTGISDRLGTVMTAKYDKDGNVAESTDSAGNRTVNTYDEDGNRLTQTTYVETEEGTKENTVRFVYNDAGELVQSVDAMGNVTSVERDARGQMTATVDSRNRRTEYSHDAMGQVTKITYSDGTSESFTYDAEGRSTKTTDRAGSVTEYVYDRAGNLTSLTDARGNVTRYSYDKNNNLLSVLSPEGAETVYEYDELNRNTTITDEQGNRTCFAYNELSLLTETTDAKGNKTSFEYDANGRRTKILYADGSSVQTGYDERGRITWQKDVAGRKTEYTYDGSDRLILVEQNNGAKTAYTYDRNGNLTGITDANGNTTSYAYDRFGRRIKTILADGSESSSEYDPTGRMSASTDYNGIRSTYEYDGQDRLTAQIVGDIRTEYAYDTLGRLTEVREGSSDIRYGELVSKTYENGQKITYEYDRYGRTEKITVLQGERILSSTNYAYDKRNRLTRVTAHDGTATVYAYDANGNKEKAVFANGQVLTYAYDALNRLVLQKAVDRDGTVIAQYSYTLGKGGEREKSTETGACGNRETAYEYDKAGRLVQETRKDEDSGEKTVYRYAYDAVGNRTEKTENGKKTVYAYNSRNQLVLEETAAGTVRCAYDANGSLLSRSGEDISNVYTYDACGRLTGYADRSETETYTYDAEGVRRSKKNETQDLVFISDTQGSLSVLLAETDAQGNLIASYIRADELISQTRGEKTSTYLYDGHGDVRALLDEEGKVTDTYRYTAYGELAEKSGGTENHFLYTGEYYDGTSGLYYLRARYMNTETGTFISMDSYEGNLSDPDSLHKYLYANGNPVKYNDPSGNASLTIDQLTIACGCMAYLSCLTAIRYNVEKSIANAGIIPSGSYALMSDIEEMIFSCGICTLKVLVEAIEVKVKENVQIYTGTKAEAKEIADKEENKDMYYVYFLKHPETDQIEYVGRTKNLYSRLTAHENSTNRKNLELAGFVMTRSYKACRAIEQAGMLGAHTLKEKDNKEYNNQINGIGKHNQNAKSYYSSAIEEWGAIDKLSDYILNQEDNERLNQIEKYINKGLKQYDAIYKSNY